MFQNSILHLQKNFLNQEATPTAHVLNEWQKIENINTQINPIVTLMDKNDILSRAKESTQRYSLNKSLGIFDGITISVKDTSSSALKGLLIHKGSKIFSQESRNEHTPIESVPCIDYLLKQGTIILCQTTVPELCFKGTTSSLLYGVTKYPYNLYTTTGGSSGGAAALACMDIATLHIGTDGAGSVRIPASCCGVFGLKPTLGLSSEASFPYLSHVGPISKYLDNIRVFMNEMLKCDKLMNNNDNIKNGLIKNNVEKYKLNFSENNIYNVLDNKLGKLKYAIANNLNNNIDFVEPIIIENVNKSVKKFVSKYKISSNNVDFNAQPLLSNENNINYMDLVRDIWCVVMWDMYGKYMNDKNKIKLMDPALYELLLLAKENNKTMENKELLNQISQTKQKLIDMMDNFFEKYDVLICPTLAILPRKAQDYTKDGFVIDRIDNKLKNVWDCHHSELAFTCLFNLTQQPALSMNCGYATIPMVDDNNVQIGSTKVPIGLQIVGPKYRDDLVLAVANAIQQSIGDIDGQSNIQCKL